MALIKKYEVRLWSGRYFEAPDEAFRIMIVLYGKADKSNFSFFPGSYL
jgi:hypothetical protein